MRISREHKNVVFDAIEGSELNLSDFEVVENRDDFLHFKLEHDKHIELKIIGNQRDSFNVVFNNPFNYKMVPRNIRIMHLKSVLSSWLHDLYSEYKIPSKFEIFFKEQNAEILLQEEEHPFKPDEIKLLHDRLDSLQLHIEGQIIEGNKVILAEIGELKQQLSAMNRNQWIRLLFGTILSWGMRKYITTDMISELMLTIKGWTQELIASATEIISSN